MMSWIIQIAKKERKKEWWRWFIAKRRRKGRNIVSLQNGDDHDDENGKDAAPSECRQQQQRHCRQKDALRLLQHSSLVRSSKKQNERKFYLNSCLWWAREPTWDAVPTLHNVIDILIHSFYWKMEQ